MRAAARVIIPCTPSHCPRPALAPTGVGCLPSPRLSPRGERGEGAGGLSTQPSSPRCSLGCSWSLPGSGPRPGGGCAAHLFPSIPCGGSGHCLRPLRVPGVPLTPRAVHAVSYRGSHWRHPHALVECLGVFYLGGGGVGRGSGTDPCTGSKGRFGQCRPGTVLYVKQACEMYLRGKKEKKKGLLWLVWFFPLFPLHVAQIRKAKVSGESPSRAECKRGAGQDPERGVGAACTMCRIRALVLSRPAPAPCKPKGCPGVQADVKPPRAQFRMIVHPRKPSGKPRLGELGGLEVG